jgi:hypothetical protein
MELVPSPQTRGCYRDVCGGKEHSNFAEKHGGDDFREDASINKDSVNEAQSEI